MDNLEGHVLVGMSQQRVEWREQREDVLPVPGNKRGLGRPGPSSERTPPRPGSRGTESGVGPHQNLFGQRSDDGPLLVNFSYSELIFWSNFTRGVDNTYTNNYLTYLFIL